MTSPGPDRPPPDETDHRSRRRRFRGQIAGVGSTSGVRVVVGRWVDTPLGAFGDAMVERPDGHRVLVAPSDAVADFITATYGFDEVRVEPVTVEQRRGPDGILTWRVDSASLELDLTLGGRRPLGRLLRLVPRPVATSPAWATLVDPVASIVLDGVRTRGTALAGRREYYGATDVHAVTSARGRFDGIRLGELRPVDPPCRFGFSSTPREPSVTDVVTTVTVR
ncbi:hypothetical protein DFJ68_3635 [Terracoccus luteus]|uniref:Uncharacterized protein n=1 Tax=Terracoccus luteus TaxID=53356 RepID=A0A495Y412_9MICO|nr:hypothetical protein [Terracoccus luteus]RKT80156.1 hypothetical protein DFJ68_3635 [Terracoccus luteus]